MVLKTPQRLTLTYSVDATQGPSGIYKPDQLTITPLYTFIRPQSFDANTFGVTRLTPSQIIVPTGLLSTEFGSSNLRNENQFLVVSGTNVSSIGLAHVWNADQYITAIGLGASALPNNHLIFNLHNYLKISGFISTIFGTHHLRNLNRQYSVPSFVATTYGLARIYNLRQHIRLTGYDASIYGTPFMSGGVKYVNVNGYNALGVPSPKVVNTRANQPIDLRSPSRGIAPPSVPGPNVSPQILTVRGILGTQWGSPYVQRNPSPKGWISERFGTAWVSRSPRFYTVGIGELTQFGSHKIFDAKQTVTVTGVIAGGIFGDIRIRNLNFKIAPLSIDAPPLSDWTLVENTARYYQLKGFNAALFGLTAIRNATPSITPNGFDSQKFGNPLIAERIRRVNTSGFNLLSFGRAVLTKTPQLSPSSIQPFDLGTPTLTLYTRYIVTSGRIMSALGQPEIGMAKRKFAVNGFDSLRLGSPEIAHGVRELLFKGANHSLFGNNHRVWFRVRSIAPVSIYDDQKQYGHKIGGAQHVKVIGFDASRFGKRIVPESQDILVDSFSPSVFGTAKLHKTRELLHILGFATGGQQPADRWGKTTIHNLRQYIVQTYDVDSDLNPPKMQGWMSIINRNRTLGVTGANNALFGRASIKNNATLMQPGGIGARPLGTAFISHYLRPIQPEGIESPYLSGWTNSHNAAAVIRPKGFSSERFGIAEAANTRRYFSRIGNFESMVFGQPTISFKVRNVAIESRNSIGPIYIPIHKIHLYKRYVEPLGNDFAALGMPSLTIHKKIITPRWYLKDLFGDVQLRNVTPEVKTKGRNAEEFGQAAIRTQWRNVDVFGENTQLFGKPVIADRKRTISVSGFIAGAIGSALRVSGTASPPLSTQYIYLNNVDNRGEDADDDTSSIKDGYGIAIPLRQVSEPSLKTNVIYPQGFDASKFGQASMYSNGILMENGIKLVKECGTPSIQLANRTIEVVGINNTIALGTPRFSPHTIYAVLEAPQQAKNNHPPNNLHAVNSDSGTRKAGEVFGNPRVWQHNPYLNARSVSPFNGYGTPSVSLKRRYVEPKGIQAYRFGWHSLGDGTQEVIHRQINDFSIFGRPGIALAKEKNVQIFIQGFNALNVGRPLIEFYHRTIQGRGFSSLQMGSSRGGSQYMPQSLHIGPRMPVIPVGVLMEKFGTTYIGLKVRDIGMQGFDSCVIGYDPKHFDLRMRVTRGQGGTDQKPTQHIQAVGFDAFHTNASNVKYAVQYIRPDGNSDQFRKGGHNAI